MFGSVPTFDINIVTFGKWHQNLTSWCQNDVLTSCTRVVFHPLLRWHFLALVGFTEILVGYARIAFLFPIFQLVLDTYSIISCLEEKYGISASYVNISLLEDANLRLGDEISVCNPLWPTSHFPEVRYEPHHDKTCLLGLCSCKTQTGLLSYRD